MRATIIAVSGLLAATAVQTQEMGDPRAGEAIVKKKCVACHGIDGRARLPIIPNIGGESPTYLANQLRAYLSGERNHPMMTMVVQSLDDRQIADVSAWYGSHHAVATLTADPALAPPSCIGCHGADGIALAEHSPHLTGESSLYLAAQLEAYRSGQRKHDIMNLIAATLSDEQIRSYSEWYAAVPLTIVPP